MPARAHALLAEARAQHAARQAAFAVVRDIVLEHGVSEEEVDRVRATAADQFAARQALLGADDQVELMQLLAERELAMCAALVGRAAAAGADYQRTLAALRDMIAFHAWLGRADTPAGLGLLR